MGSVLDLSLPCRIRPAHNSPAPPTMPRAAIHNNPSSVAIEPRSSPLRMVASATWEFCSGNKATTKARGVAHHDHRRRLKPTDLLQDTA